MGNSSSNHDAYFEPLEKVGEVAPLLGELAKCVSTVVVTDFVDDPELMKLVNGFFNGTERTFQLLLELENYMEGLKLKQTILVAGLSDYDVSKHIDGAGVKMKRCLDRYAQSPHENLDEFRKKFQKAAEAHKSMVNIKSTKNTWYVRFFECAWLCLSIMGNVIVGSFCRKTLPTTVEALSVTKEVLTKIGSTGSRGNGNMTADRTVPDETYAQLREKHKLIGEQLATVNLSLANMSSTIVNTKKACEEARPMDPNNPGFNHFVENIQYLAVKGKGILDSTQRQIEDSKTSVLEARETVTKAMSDKGAKFRPAKA